MEEIGDEERQFVERLMVTGDIEGSARGTIIDENAPSTQVRKTAMQALGDTTVRAYTIDLYEDVGLTPSLIAQTLKEGMSTNKFGINQKTGEVVDLGPDGMTRMTAVKIALQSLGILGGGPKVEPSSQNQSPPQVNIIFPDRHINDKKDIIIDGDNDYTVNR